MQKIELLAPAGGYEAFIAAVENGADAVYLGGNVFNARASANNFSDEDLKRAICYAHLRDVKVYITLNILINDFEINDAIEFAKKVYEMGADAFIVQDLGLAMELRQVIPNINLHLSTQATVYDELAIEAVDSLNFERIVLARELSLKQIEKICKNTSKEIEVFVHGAMCICYSGQCRFSSLIGERSGNRGKCAQPCRLPYTLYKNDQKITKKYILSPKDLCGLEQLPELIKMGVASLKIEGRMKNPEYVAAVTRVYRKYIDQYYNKQIISVDESDKKELLQVFNRGNFTTGYFLKNEVNNLMATTRGKHWGTFLGTVTDYIPKKKLVKVKLHEDLNMNDGVEILNKELSGNIVTYIKRGNELTRECKKGEEVWIGDISGDIEKGQEIYKITSKKLNDELKESFNGKFYKKIKINAKIQIKSNQKIKLQLSDGKNIVEAESEYIPVEAINKPISKEIILNNLSKLGSTAFELNSCEIYLDESLLVPVSIINDLRRQAVEKLENVRVDKPVEKNYNRPNKINYEFIEKEPKVSVYLYNTTDLLGLEQANRIYVPLEFIDQLKNYNGQEIIPYIKSITLNNTFKVDKIDKILIGNLSHIKEFCNKQIYADHSINVFNSCTCEYLKSLGVKGINLSFELNLEQLKQIRTNLETEVTVYGALPLMISEHCVIGSEIAKCTNCGLCEKDNYYLEDRTNRKFRILTDRENCRNIILNAKKLCATEVVSELKNINYFRAYFLDESVEEKRNIIKSIKLSKKTSCAGCTAGHFYRGV